MQPGWHADCTQIARPSSMLSQIPGFGVLTWRLVTGDLLAVTYPKGNGNDMMRGRARISPRTSSCVDCSLRGNSRPDRTHLAHRRNRMHARRRAGTRIPARAAQPLMRPASDQLAAGPSLTPEGSDNGFSQIRH
jgi:hypothetical protein